MHAIPTQLQNRCVSGAIVQTCGFNEAREAFTSARVLSSYDCARERNRCDLADNEFPEASIPLLL